MAWRFQDIEEDVLPGDCTPSITPALYVRALPHESAESGCTTGGAAVAILEIRLVHALQFETENEACVPFHQRSVFEAKLLSTCAAITM